jgi:hypothetical protein
MVQIFEKVEDKKEGPDQLKRGRYLNVTCHKPYTSPHIAWSFLIQKYAHPHQKICWMLPIAPNAPNRCQECHKRSTDNIEVGSESKTNLLSNLEKRVPNP